LLNLFSNPARSRQSRPGWRALALIIAPLGLLLAAAPARNEKTLLYQTSSSPRISLSNLSGQVVVKGWEKSQVRATCATASPQIKIEAEPFPATGPAEKIHFETRALDSMLTGQDQVADYSLDVPMESNLDIRNRQGRVWIEAISGDAWVESVGGSITVADASGHLAVRTVGGNIEIVRPSGRVEASSITGNLHFVAPASAKLRGNTTSGKIIYEGDFVSGGDYILSEYSGEMEIFCPPAASFELNAKSVRGKVVTDPELTLVPRHRALYPPTGASSLFGTHNTGAATLELTSFSGSIHIRRCAGPNCGPQ
jgi:hypothetical protein